MEELLIDPKINCLLPLSASHPGLSIHSLLATVTLQWEGGRLRRMQRTVSGNSGTGWHLPQPGVSGGSGESPPSSQGKAAQLCSRELVLSQDFATSRGSCHDDARSSSPLIFRAGHVSRALRKSCRAVDTDLPFLHVCMALEQTEGPGTVVTKEEGNWGSGSAGSQTQICYCCIKTAIGNGCSSPS